MLFRSIITLFVFIGLFGCSQKNPTIVNSPTHLNSVEFFLSQNGVPQYIVKHNDKIVIDTSSLGFEVRDLKGFDSGFAIINSKLSSFDEIWKMPWGEQQSVENNYNQLSIELQSKSELGRKLNIIFKVYDDGIGFRYEFPEQNGLAGLTIMDENTQFKLTEDYDTWWIPGDWDSYEHLYSSTKLSEIDAIKYRNHNDLAQSYIPENAVNTPITLKSEEGLYLSFHEANLTDYAGMTLKIDTTNYMLQSELVGAPDGSKVTRKLPFETPWRTIQISETAGELIESNLIVNLNEPNKLGNISWFTPTKYVGIWWEMHLNKSSWDLASGKHGATTKHAKELIDFASINNIGAILVEGWNTGWEHWIGFEEREGVFDFVTPYPDYDLEQVVNYGKSKGVELIIHHETSAAPRTYAQQMDTAYALCKKLGIHSAKTGYVGKLIPKGYYHHGQWMVNQYRKALTTAAKYHIAIDAHEPIKATGIRRTYPNAISREGLRGQEFNAWSSDGGNPPEHLAIIPFTRMLAGPIDFTPGIFDIKFNKYKKNNQVNTTLAQQLALYVVIYSPIQMAADLIENYKGKPAFQFIRDVGVNWEESHVLNGEIGKYVTIVRKERETGNWFLGSLTNEEARSIVVSLDFLDSNADYDIIIYQDGKNAHWDKNPTDIEIKKLDLTSSDNLTLQLASGGGAAISFIKK